MASLIFFIFITLCCFEPRNSFSCTDLNMDGITDSMDIRMVYLKYGSNCDACAEDINNDYEVDGNDVLLVLHNSSH